MNSAQTMTVEIAPDLALKIIAMAGGEASTRGGWDFSWGHYWMTDEAVKVALEAITETTR